jgi:hypothetical protein
MTTRTAAFSPASIADRRRSAVRAGESGSDVAMPMASAEVLPVILRSVQVGENARVFHRQLEPVIKIASDHGSGSLRKVLFQQLGKEYTAEQDRVPPPTLKRRDYQGWSALSETPDQGPDRLGREERVVHRSEEHGDRFLGKGPDSGLKRGDGPGGRVWIEDRFSAVPQGLLDHRVR